jgi:hypothetical protein
MPVIPILNLKGGVAKTVTTVALAECFASHGHRVLLIDADHQCMAGELALGESRQLKCESQKRNFCDLLVQMLDDEFEPIRKILTHLGEPLEPPPISPARGPPTDWGELVHVHDDRDVFEASPDELPAIDIHSL